MNLPSLLLNWLRVSLGLIFLWAFLDKTFGLGFATCRLKDTGAIDVFCNRAWLAGGSPIAGFLQTATRGPLANLYQSIAASPLAAWLFMLGLLGVGAALIFGFLIKFAAWCGVALMLLIYSAAWPPAQNPVIDEHVIYALLLILFTQVPATDWYRLPRLWRQLISSNRQPPNT